MTSIKKVKTLLDSQGKALLSRWHQLFPNATIFPDSSESNPLAPFRYKPGQERIALVRIGAQLIKLRGKEVLVILSGDQLNGPPVLHKGSVDQDGALTLQKDTCAPGCSPYHGETTTIDFHAILSDTIHKLLGIFPMPSKDELASPDLRTPDVTRNLTNDLLSEEGLQKMFRRFYESEVAQAIREASTSKDPAAASTAREPPASTAKSSKPTAEAGRQRPPTFAELSARSPAYRDAAAASMGAQPQQQVNYVPVQESAPSTHKRVYTNNPLFIETVSPVTAAVLRGEFDPEGCPFPFRHYANVAQARDEKAFLDIEMVQLIETIADFYYEIVTSPHPADKIKTLAGNVKPSRYQLLALSTAAEVGNYQIVAEILVMMQPRYTRHPDLLTNLKWNNLNRAGPVKADIPLYNFATGKCDHKFSLQFEGYRFENRSFTTPGTQDDLDRSPRPQAPRKGRKGKAARDPRTGQHSNERGDDGAKKAFRKQGNPTGPDE